MTCVNFASIIIDCLTITHRSDDPDNLSNARNANVRVSSNFCFEGLFIGHDKE